MEWGPDADEGQPWFGGAAECRSIRQVSGLEKNGEAENARIVKGDGVGQGRSVI